MSEKYVIFTCLTISLQSADLPVPGVPVIRMFGLSLVSIRPFKKKTIIFFMF